MEPSSNIIIDVSTLPAEMKEFCLYYKIHKIITVDNSTSMLVKDNTINIIPEKLKTNKKLEFIFIDKKTA